MNWRKIGLFLTFAFGISWLVAGLMYVLGVEYGSQLSIALVAIFYMPGPAFATLIVQKWMYKEPIKPYGWVWKGTQWRWVFGAVAFSILFTLGTMLAIYLLGNNGGFEGFGTFDFSKEAMLHQLQEVVNASGQNIDIETMLNGQEFPLSPTALLILILVSGVLAAFTINLPFMFGEELGWRGLLLHETQPMGFLKSNLLIGVVWGLWHAPIILQGHNYPGDEWIGLGAMVLFCTVLAFPFAYIRLKSKSILGPCVLHGMINGTATAIALFVVGGKPLYASIAGVAGALAIGTIALAIFVLDRKFVREYRELR